MAGHTHGNGGSGQSSNKGYETRDVKVGALGKVILILAVGIIATYALTVGLFRFFAAREGIAPAAQTTAAQQAPADEQLAWPEPRIQVNAAGDMAALRAEQEAVLGSYGWVDRQAGLVRVPIDVAMKLVLDEGLPVRQPETAPPAPGTPGTAQMPAGGNSPRTTK